MPQELNLNVSPYYDDFDRDNDYYRVLFKPGFPVQARELTTMQSILQSQVEKFGDHFFKEGKAVTGGEIQYYEKYPCVMVDDSFNGKSILEYAADIVDEVIVGRNSGVRARVDSYLPGTSSEQGFDTYYITYLSADSVSSTFYGFAAGEELVLEDGLQTTNNLSDEFETEDPDSGIQENLENLITFAAGASFARCIEENPNEIGSAVHINEGVYYIRGHFVESEEKTLLLDQYDDQPSYRVGLIVTEDIESYLDDDSLLDNAQGFSNFTAPGADRLKIEIDLAKIDLDERDDVENFVELLVVKNGQIVNNNRSKQETENAKYVAERVDDLAGDFYVDQPEVEVVESLNDKEGNGGIYDPGQLTSQGQEPSDDLGVIQISPFKAYVNGFQIEIPSSTFLDFEKPRTTKLFEDQPVEYSTGPTLSINRVYGYPTLGIQTSFYITLRDERVGSAQTIAAGKEVGVARVFDYELEDGTYNRDNLDTNTWDLALYDVRPYVEFELNAPVTLQTPIQIRGKATGATAHLRFDVSNSGIATAYEVKGRFNVGEKLIFNGVEDNQRVVKKATEFGLQQVRSIHGENSNGTYFSADTILEPSEDIPAPGLSVNITASSGSISTVSTADFNLDKVFDVGDLVSYTNPENPEIPTFNKVTAVAVRNMRLEAITSVVGINTGSLPTSAMQASNFQKIEASIESSDDNTLYTELPKDFVAKVNLEDSTLVVRKTFNVTITDKQTNAIPAGDDFKFLPFSASRYVLTRNDGTIEELTDDKFNFTGGNDQLTIKGLGSNTTGVLIATMQKFNNKSKVKIRNRIGSITIDKSRVPQSGVGGTTLNDGLTYGRYPYGTRVQDEEICLLRPDVIEILGIFESDNTQEPDVKRLEFSNFTGATQTTADLIIGERFEGANTEAIGIVVEKINDTTIGYIPANDDAFDEVGETVTFKESGATAVFVKETGSDLNITSKYDLEDGFEDTIYDYAKIVRNKDAKAPRRKLKIIYEFCTYDSADTGDITTVDSYKNFDWKDIPETGDLRHSDIIDIRPRVDFYNVAEGSRSPFEFLGRSFDGEGNSSEFILASDETINLDYSIYLPRTDRVFLDETGVFHLMEGAPSEDPAPPADRDAAIEVATIILPAYLEDVDEASIELADHKRYTMDDIGDLEDRIKQLEYYTSLNLLESATANLKITDGNGLNRFKSGFFVDDFSDAENQLKLTILKNSVDTEEGELRAAPYTTQIDLELGTFNSLGIGTDAVDARTLDPEFDTNIIGENIRQTGRIISLDYDEVVEIAQPYATDNVPITTFVDIFYQGILELNPDTDSWVRQNLGGRRVSDRKGKYWLTKRQLRKRRYNPNWGWGGVMWRDWRNHWKGTKTKGGRRRGGEYAGKQSEKLKGRRKRRLRACGGDFIPKQGRKRTRKGVLKKRSGPKRKGWGKRTLGKRFWGTKVRVGKKFVSLSIRKWMRMRNIQFKAKRMKPTTRVYPFFDNIPVMKTVTPKLVEIQMIKGTFQEGERVSSARRKRARRKGLISVKVRKNKIKVNKVRGWRWAQRFSGRVAAINHKYGPFNQPTTVYDRNPYTKTRMPTRYASNSTILNIDTFIMSLKQKGKYWGFITDKMRLKGHTSKAVCKVVSKRLITDDAGHVQGSFFIPAADANRKKKFGYAFTAGEKLFRLVDSPTNTEDDAPFTTLAEDAFRCVGADEGSKTITKKYKIIRGTTTKTPPSVGRPRVKVTPTRGRRRHVDSDPGEKSVTPQKPTPRHVDPPGPRGPGGSPTVTTVRPSSVGHTDPVRPTGPKNPPDEVEIDPDSGTGETTTETDGSIIIDTSPKPPGTGEKNPPPKPPDPTPPTPPAPKVKTAKVKYVFDKKGRALPVWYVPYTITKGKNKGKTKYLNFNGIKRIAGKKAARKAFRQAGYPLPPKKYPGRGKPARPTGGKKKSTKIAIKQNRKGVIRIVDTSKKARKLARKGKKSRTRAVIRPGDKNYGYYNKGKKQLFKNGATLVATQHRKATRRVTRRGRRKFEKRRFPVNKLPLKNGSIKRFRPRRRTRKRKRSRPKTKQRKPTPDRNKRRRVGSGYPRRPRFRSKPKPPARSPRPPRFRGGSFRASNSRRRRRRRRGRRGKRSDFLLKTDIMIIQNALNRVFRI